MIFFVIFFFGGLVRYKGVFWRIGLFLFLCMGKIFLFLIELFKI